jgi:hypothetical protein
MKKSEMAATIDRLMQENNDLITELLTFQPKAIALIRERDLVFDKAPFHKPNNEAEDWQGLAFWLYTYICEMDSLCRNAEDESCSA